MLGEEMFIEMPRKERLIKWRYVLAAIIVSLFLFTFSIYPLWSAQSQDTLGSFLKQLREDEVLIMSRAKSALKQPGSELMIMVITKPSFSNEAGEEIIWLRAINKGPQKARAGMIYDLEILEICFISNPGLKSRRKAIGDMISRSIGSGSGIVFRFLKISPSCMLRCQNAPERLRKKLVNKKGFAFVDDDGKNNEIVKRVLPLFHAVKI